MKIKKNKVNIVIFINFLLISTVCSPFIQIEVFQNNDTIASNSKPDIIDPSLEEITLVKKFDVKENVLRSSESLSLGGGPASIIDTDGRVRITPTTVYPFSAICKIRAWWGIFDGIVGTGAIVYKNHVLTAAHVVYDESKGGWADSIEVIPAQDNGFGPYGVAMATYGRIYANYVGGGEEIHDFSLLTLDSDIGLSTGAFEMQTADFSDPIYSGELHTAGYPTDKDLGLNMWYSNENGIDADLFLHDFNLDAMPGQSGSPVWYDDGYGRYLISVLAQGYPTYNQGVRLNEGKINNILAWINEDLSTPIPLQPNMRDRGLTYASFTPSTLKSDTSTIQVTCDIQNKGLVETGAYTVSFYASTDTTITTSDYVIGITTEWSIPAKSFRTVTFSRAFPSVPTGNYYIGWIIDAFDSIAELREDDNAACYTSAQILVDNDAPLNPTICNQLNGSTTSDQWQNSVNNPNFNWSGASDAHTGVDGYYYYWGTSSTGTSLAYTTSGVYDPPEVTSGIYYLRVQTQDSLGNLAPWATIYTFRYDDINPNSILNYTVVNPPDIVTIYTEFSISAADIDGSGIFNISYRINDSSWFIYNNPFTLSGFSGGYNSIDYYATDLTGNIEPVNSEIVYLDKDPPSTTIHFIKFGVSYINVSTVFSFSGDDGTGSGVNNTYYRIDGGPWLHYLTSFTLDGFANGDHTIDFYSIDYGDNFESIKWKMVYLDLYAPSTILVYKPEILPNRVNTSTIFEFSMTDGTGSGIRSMLYRVDGEPWINSDGAFNLTSYGAGNHTIEYYCIDNVGNQEGYNNERVFLIIPEESTTANISGYGLILLFPSIILTVLVVIVQFKKKTLKFKK